MRTEKEYRTVLAERNRAQAELARLQTEALRENGKRLRAEAENARLREGRSREADSWRQHWREAEAEIGRLTNENARLREDKEALIETMNQERLDNMDVTNERDRLRELMKAHVALTSLSDSHKAHTDVLRNDLKET